MRGLVRRAICLSFTVWSAGSNLWPGNRPRFDAHLYKRELVRLLVGKASVSVMNHKNVV